MAFWIRSLPLLALVVLLAPIASHAFADQFLCGDELTDTLIMVCGERGIHNPFQRFQDMNEYQASAEEELPWNKKKRGIVEECCDNPCTLYQLERYCNKP
ncbi:insulin-like [Paroedura picta]|uniref:insulin-like n=1 Tax=Paroedura picta TaxID=143630 RepID=UPI004057510F